MANRLANETSPYLLQHAHNPVEWYPWGPEALQKAKDEGKPLLVSIGYAACHWCHVMERESFEDEQVARLMNELFVCIKVDREERPDVDKIYMDAVMVMSGRGGWPLNAFALPDGRPIYGGTYYSQKQWMSVLQQVSDFYQKTRDRATAYASELVKAMHQMDKVENPGGHLDFQEEELQAVATKLLNQSDSEWGGRNVRSNKFPLPQNSLFMIRLAHYLGHEDLQQQVKTNLEKMAHGGIYDHLGGGFARYSVDAYWKVPHFEKMLYDNGQLMSLYSEAFLNDPQPLYRQVVSDTLDFVARELTSPEGGFYSSLDADSEGEEGKFYVWEHGEVAAILGEDLRPFVDYYNVQPSGNWEGKNVLFVLETEEEFAERWNLDAGEFAGQMKRSREKLLQARETRVRPGLDDKILASWNGLMLLGCVDAYRAFREPRFLEMALRNATFISEKMSKNGRLYRNYKGGNRSIPGFLDDYANVIAAYVGLYQVTFDEQWLHQADAHLQYVMEHFTDLDSPLFFYTSDEGEILVRRKTERQDDVIPASNSVLAMAMQDLGLLLDRSEYRDMARKMLATMRHDLLELPAWHSNWGQQMLREVYPYPEVAISGEKAMDIRLELEQPYGHRLFAGAIQPSALPLLVDRHQAGKTMIYVCEGYTCQLPTEKVDEARELMR